MSGEARCWTTEQKCRPADRAVSFSLTAGYAGWAKAREYLARDRKSPSVPVSIAALEQARERLAARGSFDLPSADELAL
ncbi:hypothetical protein DB30_04794 [Enhygromyxa salina]|uniref:Uncharacterized protein n=1 Tax=Enhygromyxa salina TaxID=215803 RepID=A0A0C1ZFA5_9BACT|nr:hypothetical protein [Enhygromyxa salina]KIG16334.1 hypothetical protein DB30_04794 [Enhygromyxa salina]